KKSKPVYVKMSGSRRAAENRARQLYTDAVAQKAADAQAAIDARVAAAAAAAEANAVANAQNTNAARTGDPYAPQFVAPGFAGSNPPVIPGGYAATGYGVGSYGFPQSNNAGYPGNGYFNNSGFFSPGVGVVGYPGAYSFGNQNAGGLSFGSGFPYGF
ncbi:MAG: hypothetical protein H8F28_16730, partial [Fibrella sp.]|nr:hypothetical protein [Armatimonadota bacterium]